jgi:molecular chaperone GrpE (heat shock protein)
LFEVTGVQTCALPIFCTFEEILTHSVSRLKESANEAVTRIAARLRDTYGALEVLLRKNNITPIRPAPRDIFNGKEHEVLVAEKQDGFAKGEIIKLLGSGYRYNGQVLMRANVIAAR